MTPAPSRERRRRVLYVAHNHPVVRPGGAEAYALELHLAMRHSPDFEPVLLAKAGPPMSAEMPAPGEPIFRPVGDEPDQYFMYTDGARYDWLLHTLRDKENYTRHFRDFLLRVRPDVVHFQHTMGLGYDLIRQVRTTLPGVPIVYTLHELLPICHRHGQMVRATDESLCDAESPRRCHECFPGVSPESFLLRKRFALAHFDLVDLFIAPSRFLLERYVAWGIPRERIVHEEYGRLDASPPPEPRADAGDRSRSRFGFFGQLTRYKGVDVLLRAMQLLQDTNAHLRVHGANLEMQPGTFQNEVRSLMDAQRDRVTFVGRYDHERLPALMAAVDWVVVPSVWWENSPLVIQEAFRYGRPVICSDIGGMAEKVTDGVDGLHFRAGDADHLAATLRRAAQTPGLWATLRRGIRPVYAMQEHIRFLSDTYRALIRQAETPAAAGAV